MNADNPTYVKPVAGSLFTGIGGLDLGLERAGWRVAWQSEVDPYCCRVLGARWPEVPNLGDVTTVDFEEVEPVELICGGYPCQPFSVAGPRPGTDDARHLWPHFARALRVLRPRFALLENVPGHLSLGFGDVLADLAALGYDAEWESVPAAAFGAPHLRWRVFVVAYTSSQRWDRWPSEQAAWRDATEWDQTAGHIGDGGPVAYTGSSRRRQDAGSTSAHESSDAGWAEAHHHIAGCDGEGDRARHVAHTAGSGNRAEIYGDETVGAGPERPSSRIGGPGWWDVEPDVGRVADGVPARVDRLRALGNAVVPQVAEWVGSRILLAR